MSRVRFLVLASLAGGLTAVALTWPLVLHLRSRMLDDGTFDAFQFTWNLWWVREALLTEHTSPFYTHLLFHPTGVPLLFHTGSFSLGLLALPLQLLLPHDPAAVHNLVVLAMPVLTVVAVGLLAREAGADGWGAIAGGVATAVTPAATWFVPVLYLSCAGMLALLVWAWWRMQRVRSAAAVVLAFVVLVLLLFASQEYAVMALMLLGLDSAVRTLAPRTFGLARPWWRGTLAFWAAAGVFMGGLAHLASENPAQLPPPLHVEVGSASLLGFVVAPWLLPPLVPFLAVAFLGTVPLLLVVVALVRAGVRARFWLLALAAMLVMALGPHLHLLPPFVFFPTPNTPYTPSGPPGPYMLLAWLVPILRYFRAPYRWMTAAHVVAGVLVALAVTALRAGRAPRGRTAATVLVLLAVAGGAVGDDQRMRAPLVSAAVPAPYAAIIDDPEGGAVLDLPAGVTGAGLTLLSSRYMYWQTHHHRPILDGTVSRLPPNVKPMIARELQSFAEVPGLRWVVVHRDLLAQAHPFGRQHAARLIAMLPAVADVVADDGTTQVWKLRPTTPP